jgi:integrase
MTPTGSACGRLGSGSQADEARRFLQAARNDRLYALYSVALALGLRRGEALALRWSDVDLDQGVLAVRHTLQRADGQLQRGPVKTDGSERQVAIPVGLREALRRHRALQQVERDEAGGRWREHGLLFTTKIGTPIEPRNLNRHFDRLCGMAGVRRIRVHDLRHSCATLMYDQGVPLEQIQDVLGHSSPTVTKTIYVGATRKVQQGAVERLGFLFDE